MVYKHKGGKMKTLLEQFNEMNKMSIFEINLQDYGLSDNEDYTYTHIMANECGLRCEGVDVEWDNNFSLNEHLQELFELWIEELSK